MIIKEAATRGVLCKKVFLEISENLQENTCTTASFLIKLQALFFNKVVGLRPEACNFIKKETLANVFSCEFCEITKNTFFTEHLWTAASLITDIRKSWQNLEELSPNCCYSRYQTKIAQLRKWKKFYLIMFYMFIYFPQMFKVQRQPPRVFVEVEVLNFLFKFPPKMFPE